MFEKMPKFEEISASSINKEKEQSSKEENTD